MYKSINELPNYLKAIIITNIFYYGLLIPGALLYRGYSPLTHTVSSIGSTTKNPDGWIFFSLSLIFMAYTLLWFIYGLKSWYISQPFVKKTIIPIQIIGYFNSFAMIMIAIHPTDLFSSQHNFWSLVNFICIELVILFAIIGLRNHPVYDNRLSLIAVLDFVCCFVYLNQLPVNPYAPTLEWITFILILTYLLILGFIMHKNKLKETPQ